MKFNANDVRACRVLMYFDLSYQEWQKKTAGSICCSRISFYQKKNLRGNMILFCSEVLALLYDCNFLTLITLRFECGQM